MLVNLKTNRAVYIYKKIDTANNKSIKSSKTTQPKMT